MSRAVCVLVIDRSETACLRILMKEPLLERALIASDLVESVQNVKVYRSVESFLVRTAASMLV